MQGEDLVQVKREEFMEFMGCGVGRPKAEYRG
jgi:hypothetical protein